MSGPGGAQPSRRRRWRLIAGACAALLLVAGAVGAISGLGKNSFGAAEFAFLRVGETTPEAAKERCGAPFLDYETAVFADEIDPFVSMDEPEHYRWQLEESRRTGRNLVSVYVLEYRNPSASWEYAKLVFRDGRLWYALLPPAFWESLFIGIELGHLRKPAERRIPVQAFDFRYTATIWTYPDLGVGYLRTIGPRVEAKILFAPEKRSH